jgi:hypothetical protein
VSREASGNTRRRGCISEWTAVDGAAQVALVLVVVLVLESGHAECWSSGVLEYCAESELHPRSGFGMLKGR